MSKSKKHGGEEVPVETSPESTDTPAERGPQPAPVFDPFDRLGLSDLVQWPSWFGRRWPDRFPGEFEGIRIEQYMDGDELVIRGEMPGVDPEGIDVSVDRDLLTIRAERESKTESEEENGYRSEFRYGSFARSVGLPDGASEDDISASYEDGILEVRIPVEAGASAAKRIAVTRS